MINISDAQMKEIEYIIHQSMNGFNVLFDNDTIKRFCYGVEDDDDIFDQDRASSTERLMEIFMSTPTINARKKLFDSLNEEEQSILIRTYFNIVENNILNSKRMIN